MVSSELRVELWRNARIDIVCPAKKTREPGPMVVLVVIAYKKTLSRGLWEEVELLVMASRPLHDTYPWIGPFVYCLVKGLCMIASGMLLQSQCGQCLLLLIMRNRYYTYRSCSLNR
jgi:hypothetical protein